MRPHSILLAVLVLLVLSPVGALCQAPSAKTPAAAAQPQSTPNDSLGSSPNYSQEPYIYEFVHGNLRYENDGAGIRKSHVRIHVQTPAGLAKIGQLVFQYNAANETLEVESVRVIKPDGTVVTAGPESIQDLSAPVARLAPVYTDAREKHITLPSLSVGDMVEYHLIVRSQPLQPGQFWHTFYLVADAICLDQQVELNVPRARDLKISALSDSHLQIRDDGDRRIYLWKASTLQLPDSNNPLKNFKMDLQSLLEGPAFPSLQHVSFSTFRSWEDVGRWYASLERDRRVLTPELQSRAAEITRGSTNDAEKAEEVRRSAFPWPTCFQKTERRRPLLIFPQQKRRSLTGQVRTACADCRKPLPG